MILGVVAALSGLSHVCLIHSIRPVRTAPSLKPKRFESISLEFKKSTATLKAATATLCAYLNGQGGTLLIGVTDSGDLVGQTITDHTQLEIANYIAKIEPAAAIDFEYLQTSPHNCIIVMFAKPNLEAMPYVFDGKPYWRVLSSTRAMPQQRYQQLLMERINKLSPWDTCETQSVSLEALDHKEIINTIAESIRKGRLEARYDTTDPLTALRLLKLTNSCIDAASLSQWAPVHKR